MGFRRVTRPLRAVHHKRAAYQQLHRAYLRLPPDRDDRAVTVYQRNRRRRRTFNGDASFDWVHVSTLHSRHLFCLTMTLGHVTYDYISYASFNYLSFLD